MKARGKNLLRPDEAKAATKTLNDGGGLFLKVRGGGAYKSWVYRWRDKSGQHETGLGSFDCVSLKYARRKRDELLVQVRDGFEPIAARKIKIANRLILEDRIAAKAATFVENDIEPVCYLYRHYDPSGDLIYAGFTLAPLRRTKEHRAGAAWRQMILQILIEPFASREEALEAETRAIREEFPRFNKTHNRRRHPMNEAARHKDFNPANKG